MKSLRGLGKNSGLNIKRGEEKYKETHIGLAMGLSTVTAFDCFEYLREKYLTEYNDFKN